MVGKLTPDWMLSASRIPVLLNASPYQTQNDLLAEMIKIDEGGEPTRIPQNELMAWGDRLENIVLTEAASRLGLTNVETEFDEAVKHDHLPLAASLDGVGCGKGDIIADLNKGIYTPGASRVNITGLGCLEAKTTQAMAEDLPPAHRGILQLQCQMMCTGYAWGVVAVLYRGSELRLFVYQADPAVQSRIMQAVHDFEQRRKNKDWYEPVSAEDAATAYGRVDPSAPPIELASEQARDWLNQLVVAKRNKAAAEQDIDEASAAIMQIMGSHKEAVGTVGNQMIKVTWPERRFKAQPERIVPAKPETVARQKTLTIKELN
jgi:predicted phage-related endonuclease